MNQHGKRAHRRQYLLWILALLCAATGTAAHTAHSGLGASLIVASICLAVWAACTMSHITDTVSSITASQD